MWFEGENPFAKNLKSLFSYLIYIIATGEDETRIEVCYEDENIWLTQKMMCALYGVSKSTISEHLTKIFGDNELDENSVVRKPTVS